MGAARTATQTSQQHTLQCASAHISIHSRQPGAVCNLITRRRQSTSDRNRPRGRFISRHQFKLIFSFMGTELGGSVCLRLAQIYSVVVFSHKGFWVVCFTIMQFIESQHIYPGQLKVFLGCSGPRVELVSCLNFPLCLLWGSIVSIPSLVTTSQRNTMISPRPNSGVKCSNLQTLRLSDNLMKP